MTEIKRIAVIGATGMLGLPVTRALVQAGFAVTALARNPEAAKRVLPPEVAVAAADVRDEESLRRGLQGHDGLYLSLSVAPGDRPGDFHTEGLGLQHILSAAHAAGIKRIGYLSAIVQDAEDDWWVLEVWRSAIARIKDSGIPYTIFYASNLMETLAQRHMVGPALVIPGPGHYCNYWIAGADFGAQVARAFAIEEAANREYFVQGPEPVSYAEAAQRYAKSAPRRLRVVAVPVALLRFLGLFSRAMRFNAHMMATVLRYPEEFKAGAAWDELGRPTTTIEAFARGGEGL